MLAQISKLIIRWQPPLYLLVNLIPYLPEDLHSFKYGILCRGRINKTQMQPESFPLVASDTMPEHLSHRKEMVEPLPGLLKRMKSS